LASLVVEVVVVAGYLYYFLPGPVAPWAVVLLSIWVNAAAIRYFGSRDRINHCHFRNVKVEIPYYKYTEVMHDEGECDMLACMKAFHEVGYAHLIIPDHTPEFSGDTVASQRGWAFALGYMHALRQAAQQS